MRKRKTLKTAAIVLVVIALTGCILFLLSMKTMLFLPKGEPLCASVSPDGNYTVRAYVCYGGATVDNAVRCEIVGNHSLRRNLYWQYHASSADIRWSDNDTVWINGVALDATRGRYDYRRDADDHRGN